MAPRGKRGRPKKVEAQSSESTDTVTNGASEVPTKKAKTNDANGRTGAAGGMKIVIEHW